MSELVRLFIDRLLGWPVAVFGICLIFQKPMRLLLSELTTFVGRASRISVKHNDTAIEALSEAKSQAKQGSTESAEYDLGAGSAIAVSKSSESADTALERSALIDYGKGVPSVQAIEKEIRSELRRLDFDLTNLETIEMLIRQLATQRCVSFFERTYRVIFGSQLSAVDFLNTNGPVPKAIVEMLFYDSARNLEAEFYSDFPFEQWLSFLLTNLLKRNCLEFMLPEGGF